mgnify:CR=1 FL=1
MSSRPLLKPQSVVTNGNMATSLTSLATNINMVSILSYTIVWTGSPTGTFSVQVSNDYIPNPLGVQDAPVNAGTWVALSLSTTVAPAGSGSSAFIDIDTCGAAWIRLVYTRSSGTGTLNATIAGKSA